MATLFFSYSHGDEPLRDELEKHLTMLKRQGVIETWHDRRIVAGSELDSAISEHVKNDDIILLLVSSDFLASKYCYDVEMERAMQRHESGEAVVIPVILRPCDWHDAPFGKLLAAPTDGLPITKWADRDDAFLDVTKSVRSVAESLGGSTQAPEPNQSVRSLVSDPFDAIRSSNLRVSKDFTDRDRDKFRMDAFEYMARFFENSLHELATRNDEIEGVYERVDGRRFTAATYRRGALASECTIYIGDGLGSGGIAFVHGRTTASNSYNESMTVEADDQRLYLRASGMASFASGTTDKLTMEGAAELYWALLVRPLQ